MDAASTVVTKNFRIGIPPLPWHLALAEYLHVVAGNVDRADFSAREGSRQRAESRRHMRSRFAWPSREEDEEAQQGHHRVPGVVLWPARRAPPATT